MFPGQGSPSANVPTASTFRTPKPVDYRSRIRSRDRGSGHSSASAESIASRDVTYPDPSAVQMRLSSESIQSDSTPLDAASMQHRLNAMHLRNNYHYSASNCPTSQAVLHPSNIPYTNKPESGVLHGNEVQGRSVAAGSQNYGSFNQAPTIPRTMLTDADKIQQFTDLSRHSNDNFSHWTPTRQPHHMDIGYVQANGRQLVGDGHLVAEHGRHSYESNLHVPVDMPFYGTAPSHDLTAWLQQHKKNLKCQQLTDGLSQHKMGHYGSTGNLADGPDRVELLKQAADDIIKAKDKLIERQNAKILQLETNVVKSRFTVADNGASNEQALERKLGATEYELREAKKLFESKLLDRENTINDLKEEMKLKDVTVRDWESKCAAHSSEIENLQKQIASHNRYVSVLPTKDEHASNLLLIKSLKEELSKQKSTVDQMEKKLRESTNVIQSRDSVIQVLEESAKEMKSKIKDLETCNHDLLEKLSTKVELMELERLQRENKRLMSDLETAKRLNDGLNNQLQQKVTAHRTLVLNHKEQLDHEAAAVAALQQQVRDKEELIRNYKQTIKEITAENQNLVEKKIKMEDELKTLRNPDRVEEQKLQHHLFVELDISFSDLQKLVKVCLEKSNGQDPNLASLLGIRDSSISDHASLQMHSQGAVSLNSLKSLLSQARNLRHEIDKLREIIADKFAEDMGRRLTCNPQ